LGTTAWSVIRDEIGLSLGIIRFATTTDISATTNAVSTTLAKRYVKDDQFIDWWLLPEADGTSDVNAQDLRKVIDYTATAGKVDIAGANYSAATGATEMSLHRFHPLIMQDHFNRARQDLFPDLGIVRALATIVTGQRQFTYTLPSTIRDKPLQVMLGTRDPAATLAENLFTDGGVEDWTNSTTPASWTLAGTNAVATQEQETTTPTNYAVLQDQNSARILSADSGVTTFLQTVTPDVATEGMEANVSVWVYSNVADRVSASAAGTLGTTHTGTGWELLTATAILGSGATTVAGGISCTAPGSVITFYVDELLLSVGQSSALDREWEPILNWDWIPPVAGASNGGTLEFMYGLPAKRRLRIMAWDLLSGLTTDTATTEIDGQQLAIIYNKTREAVIREELNSMPIQDRKYWGSEADRYAAMVSQDINDGKGSPNVKTRLRAPDWGRDRSSSRSW
jgi:hypothetical protein